MSNNKTTTEQRPPKRYEVVKGAYAATRERIIEIGCITEDQYHEQEFKAGLNLVESYFHGMKPEKVADYKRRVLQDEDFGFWRTARQQVVGY